MLANESTLSELEQTVGVLLQRLEELEQENYNLRKQVQATQLISEQLSQKNSRASQSIRRLISSIQESVE